MNFCHIPIDPTPEPQDACVACGHSFWDHYDCYELGTDPACLIDDCECDYMKWPVSPSL